MDDLVKNITLFIQVFALIICAICLVTAVVLSIRSNKNKDKVKVLKPHCDKLSHDLKLLSEKWKA